MRLFAQPSPPALVELCCGSAAVTLRAMGRRPLLTYQGGKSKFAKRILSEMGFKWAPGHTLLVDAGPWGETWQAIASCRLTLIERLEALGDPREEHARLKTAAVPFDRTDRAVAHLALQMWNWRNKAVGVRDGRWVTDGFNDTNAYGLAGTPKFGAVNPQLPTLIAKLKMGPIRVVGVMARIENVDPIPDSFVYIDPDYQGTTGYVEGIERDALLAVVERHASAGCLVAVSEAEPLPGAVRTVEIGSRSSGALSLDRKRPKPAEWLSLYGARSMVKP